MRRRRRAAIVVGPNFLISLHDQPLPFADELRERTGANLRLGRHASSYVLYVLMDTLVGRYARELDEVEALVRRWAAP